MPVSLGGAAGTANLWAETLDVSAPDARVDARYGASNGWLDGQPAVVTRKVGKGSITYVGAWLDAASLKRLTASLFNESGVQPLLAGVPDAVEVCLRSGAGRSVLVLINHGTSPAAVPLPASFAARHLAGEEPQGGSVTLPKYGVAVLQVQPAAR